MIIITATTDKGKILPLGRQDEKNARQVWFDLTWLIENFGEGTAELRYQRSKDGAPYIVTNAVRESNRLVWTISRTDVAHDGFGKAEIVWTVTGADTEAKTVVYRTNVLASLAADTEIPDPYESWYDRMMEQIGDNQEYARQAAAAAQAAGISADRAEQASEDIESASVILSASSAEPGIVTINANIVRG